MSAQQNKFGSVVDLMTPETFRFLVAFEENHESFLSAATSLDEDPRKVRKAVKDLDEAYSAGRRSSLLKQSNDRHFALTAAGKAMVQYAREQLSSHELLLQRISDPDRVSIVVPSNGFPLYKKLNEELAQPERAFDFDTVAMHSAEINLNRLPQGPNFFFLSVLTNVTNNHLLSGTVWQPQPGLEMLTIDVEEIQIVLNDQLPVGKVRASDIVAKGFCFQTPSGGVSWDYLQQVMVEDWTLKYPAGHKNVPDLNCGLTAMACEDRKLAMVVHGVTAERMKASGLNAPCIRGVRDDNGDQWRAVTGLVFRSSDDENFQQVWKAAQTVWSGQGNSTTTRERAREI